MGRIDICADVADEQIPSVKKSASRKSFFVFMPVITLAFVGIANLIQAEALQYFSDSTVCKRVPTRVSQQTRTMNKIGLSERYIGDNLGNNHAEKPRYRRGDQEVLGRASTVRG